MFAVDLAKVHKDQTSKNKIAEAQAEAQAEAVKEAEKDSRLMLARANDRRKTLNRGSQAV